MNHGTEGGYTCHRCRCDLCRTAANTARRRRRQHPHHPRASGGWRGLLLPSDLDVSSGRPIRLGSAPVKPCVHLLAVVPQHPLDVCAQGHSSLLCLFA
jgi:hypothetical protein